MKKFKFYLSAVLAAILLLCAVFSCNCQHERNTERDEQALAKMRDNDRINDSIAKYGERESTGMILLENGDTIFTFRVKGLTENGQVYHKKR